MKKLMLFMGNTAAASAFITMYLTFMGVYFGKFSGIDINNYGEANFEFIMLLIALPMVIYTLIYNVKALHNDN